MILNSVRLKHQLPKIINLKEKLILMIKYPITLPFLTDLMTLNVLI